jgi:hypothetical protein
MQKLSGFLNRLIRECSKLNALPFVETKMAVLYATFAGILLSAGAYFVLWIFDDNMIRPWGPRQTAGLLLIFASLMTSLVAWFLQFFGDHLVDKGKEKESLEEKRVQFCSWRGRWPTRAFLLLALILCFAAVGVLASLVGEQTIPVNPDCTPLNGSSLGGN